MMEICDSKGEQQSLTARGHNISPIGTAVSDVVVTKVNHESQADTNNPSFVLHTFR